MDAQDDNIINILKPNNNDSNDSYHCWYHCDDCVHYRKCDGMCNSGGDGGLCDNLHDNLNDDIY